ncbi:MAG TPA: hypothetical protein VFJ15_03905 [Oleiagrimonas sp.]|nr:hypothetical protein [Oleiagrimonas sp.]
MKVKIFFCKDGYLSKGKFANQIEDGVNEWLAQNPGVKVVDMRQSLAGGSAEPPCVVISLWYED